MEEAFSVRDKFIDVKYGCFFSLSPYLLDPFSMFWHFARVYALDKMNLSGEKLLKIHIDNEVLRLKSEFRSIQFSSVGYGTVQLWITVSWKVNIWYEHCSLNSHVCGSGNTPVIWNEMFRLIHVS